MMINRKSIVDAARSYLGVRYHHQGRNRAGLDCLGLVVLVARDLGINPEDAVGYGRVPVGRDLQEGLASQLVLNTPRGWKVGDVLLMRFDAEPQHVALVTDNGIIHSYALARRVVEHSLDRHWCKRVVASYSFPGVEP